MTALEIVGAVETATPTKQSAQTPAASLSSTVSASHGNNNEPWRTNGRESDAVVLERLATTGPGKQHAAFPQDGLQFTSRFDGGNMRKVERVANDTYHIELSEDASECGISTGYTTWFHFEVQTQNAHTAGAANPRELQVVLTNMNGQKGLYSNGYTVMHCAVDSTAVSPGNCERVFENEKQWRRLPTPLSFEKYIHKVPVPDSFNENPPLNASTVTEPAGDTEDDSGVSKASVVAPAPAVFGQRMKQETKMKMGFTYRFQFAQERVRFAFCYPYSYTRLQKELSALDRKYPPSQKPAAAYAPTLAHSKDDSKTAAIYYHRELLTRSIEGLRVDLLTISSRDDITSTREPPMEALSFANIPPEHQHRVEAQRAFSFDVNKKKTVLISARVHPGETPANFMLDGMLELLLHPTDEGAISLRRHFVFKIIPMLNPDGVCQGYYRTDTRGVNLNRVYEAPSPDHAPTVFAAKEVLLQIVNSYGGAGSKRALENVVYLDLHAHASRRGCFVYGNNLVSGDSGRATQIETQLFARLVGLNTPFFDYLACSFDKDNMSRRDLRDNNNATTSREGSGRVALYKATGLTYVYTIECNYNEGRRNLRLSSTTSPLASPASGSPSGLRRSSSQSSLISSEAAAGTSNALARHVAASGGTRLYMKYSPAEWIDVGIGSLTSLLDLFQLPGRSKKVHESPFRSLDGIRKSLWSEIKAAELASSASSSNDNNNNSSGSSDRDVKSKARAASSTSTATTLPKRPSSKM